MFNRIFSLFASDLGVDLGTTNTQIFVAGKGVAVREPTVVARNKKTKEIVAVGTEAKKMIGRTPGQLEVVRPLRGGVVFDFEAVVGLLSHYIKELHQSSGWRVRIPKPRVVIGIPMGVTDVEKKAVADAAFEAGAREVSLIEEPLAAAVGGNLPILEAAGALLVDIGGGTCEMAVISLGGIVIGKTIRIAGDELDEAIINFIRLKHSVLIGLPTAENIKIQIGSVIGEVGVEEKLAIIRGRDLSTGLPKALRVNGGEVREAMMPIVNQIVGAISDLVEEVPPELLGDIAQRGIFLSGGIAQLKGFDKLVTEGTKMPCYVIDDPLTAVVRGCGRLVSDDKLLRKIKSTGGYRNG